MSIKQAIEALESCTPGDWSTGHVIHPSYDEDKVNAALAALRSMPQGEPVATIRYERGTPGKENDMPKVVSCNWLPDGVYSVYATPHTEAVRMSDQEIDAITDQQWRDKSDTPIYAAYRSYARAIEQAIGRASRGAK